METHTPSSASSAPADDEPQHEPHSAPQSSGSGNLLTWFAGHHVAANLLMIFILLSGLMALLAITVEILPEINIDRITIRVPYRGASPAEVESGVILRVEEAIAATEGIKRMTSAANEGFGLVTVELEEDADNRQVLDDIKAAVDRIDTFPTETEKPIIAEIVTRRQVMSVVVHGDLPIETLTEKAERIRDDLTSLDDISQAELRGVPPYEISIEVSEDALRRYSLSFDQVAQAIRRSSLDLPGGSVKTDGGEILLRTEAQRYTGEEFENIVVLSSADGTEVRLGQIAAVRDGFEETAVAARFDGEPAVLVQVYRTGDEGALEVTAAARSYIADLQPNLPPSMHVSTWLDTSKILHQRINLLLKNARVGLVLVFISLALFLDFRLAFWTTMGIPISFMGGLWLLPHFDITINMISLFAFIVSLGIVVDDAIVVGENVYSHLQKGKPPLQAAVQGVQEMAMPVIYAVLTSVAAFMPLVFVQGSIGKVMRNIPVVVIAVLFMSLVESLLILPAHIAGDGKKGGGFFRPITRFFDPVMNLLRRLRRRTAGGLERFIDGPYHDLLESALEWRYLSAASAFVILLLSVGLVGGGFTKFTFQPDVDADNMVAYLKMPQGTPDEQTAAISRRIEEAARIVAESYDSQRQGPPIINHVSITVGAQPTSGGGGPTSAGSTAGTGSHLAEVNVELLASEQRGISSTEIMNRWRQEVGGVPGAVALTYNASLFNAGDAVSVRMAHHDEQTLFRSVDRMKGILAEYPGVFDISDSFEPGKKELRLELTPEGQALGVDLLQLARQTRQGFYGEEIQRIQRGRSDVRVMVRYPEDQRTSMGDIEAMRVRLGNGSEVPFQTVASVSEGRGFATINRVDRRRVVTVSADVDEGAANANEINDALRADVIPQMVADFPGLSFDFEGEQREQAETMDSLKGNFIMALVAIFALLAIPFRSYTQPLIVMSVIPFGFVGALAGHLIMGVTLTILSFFGIVALTGVVVNDSLIMIDLINRRRREGISLDIAIREAGKQRFRPIFLTTLTTFMGLTPIIFETSLQAKFLIPMALSLGFGIVFATAVTLILVPVTYRILQDIHDLFDSLSGHQPDSAVSAVSAVSAFSAVSADDERLGQTTEPLNLEQPSPETP